MNYKLKQNAGATGLESGRVYTREELEKVEALGGFERLVSTGVLEETSEKRGAADDGVDPRSADENTGNPPPLSKEEGKVEEARAQREGAMPAGDGTKARTASAADVKKAQAEEAKREAKADEKK